MKIYIGFDDTDVEGAKIGTGRLARMFEAKLPQGARMWGALRHQLLVDPRIPYTSHNSPACVVVEIDDEALIPELIARAIAHLDELASPGSDPGLCVARDDADFADIVAFGLSCAHSLATQADAVKITAAAGVHLSGHGGTNDGIIGATAAVGLSVYGWSGRFLEYGRLRALPNPVSVGQLRAAGILAAPVDLEARALPDDALVHTKGWLSPRLWGGRAVAPLQQDAQGRWIAFGKKPRDAEIAE